MRIEYDPERDLLYLSFVEEDIKVAETITITPGVYADFDKNKRLIGIEVLEASKTLGKKVEFKLPEFSAA